MKMEQAPVEKEVSDEKPAGAIPSITRRRLSICAIIFFVALGVRLLSWQDNRYEARKVQTAVTEGYKHTARLMQQNGLTGFFSSSTPLSDANHLGHPPGYPILIGTIFYLFGESDAALQIFQILIDSAAAVIIFLISLALLNTATATIAGLLVAFAPQFTYNSVMLLPDTLSVAPVLLAVYFLIRAIKRPRLITIIMAGALMGLSCWLRANTMLLAPFIAISLPLLVERGKRLRAALALVGGSLLVILPLTIRNAIVYQHFIPVSLGAGQTFLEGIADYDEKRTLGIPNTDMGLMKWESELYGRPDYYGTLFNPDGVKRDRQRLAYGLSVVRSHPFWFLSVMARRGLSMFRLERTRLISTHPPVTHSLAVQEGTAPLWSASPRDLNVPQGNNSVLITDNGWLRVQGYESKILLTSSPITIAARTDYVLKLPVRIEQGRVMASVVSLDNSHQYVSAFIEPQELKAPSEQPSSIVELPFVSNDAGQVQLVLENAGAEGTTPVLEIGQVSLYALGASSFNWTRPLRALVRLPQKLFITAISLPLALCGLLLLIRRREWSTIVLLMVVPAYFISIQSALHTEYRYVLAIHYFLFALVAVALYRAGIYVWKHLLKIQFMRRRAGATFLT